MIKSQLDSIEKQLDKLISSHQDLTTTNKAMCKKTTSSSDLQNEALNKNKKTAAALKKIVKQLQDGLLCQTQKK